METLSIQVDRERARELYRAYLTHQNYEKPIDEEVRRTYRLIAQGRLIIRALASVVAAGVGDDGFPKLAIARADQKAQRCVIGHNGSAFMSPSQWARRRTTRLQIDWPPGSFPPRSMARGFTQAEAIVPLIPLPLRPKRALENYHILWEADWSRAVPYDPVLLRRLGKGDLWLVVAQWDLTDVERAALAARVNVA